MARNAVSLHVILSHTPVSSCGCGSVRVVGPLEAVNAVYLTLTSAALLTPLFPKSVLHSNHSDGECLLLHLITECIPTRTHSDLGHNSNFYSVYNRITLLFNDSRN